MEGRETVAEVMVRGEGEARSRPDRAQIGVTVEGRGSSPQAAFTAATASAATVDALLARYSEAIAKRTTAGVLVEPVLRWTDGQSHTTGWIARRITSVEVTDLEKLANLVSELPGAGAFTVNGPSWMLDPGNPSHQRARQEAAADARRRASDYAETLGLRLGRLLWLSEPGLRLPGGGVPHQGPRMRKAAQLAAASAPAPEPMEIASDEIHIRAWAEACFELLEADEA